MKININSQTMTNIEPIYSEINTEELSPPLPPRNPSNSIYMNNNPCYVSTSSKTVQTESIYETISDDSNIMPPLLPPRNSSSRIPMDTNPAYVSSDDLEPIYEIIPPKLPLRNNMDVNPCYVSSNDIEPIYEIIPPALPIRGIHFHNRFRALMRSLNNNLLS